MTAQPSTSFTGTSRIGIRASAEKIWDALTNPAIVKQYLFGTEVISDWKIGSPIRYKGLWKDKPYEDKGTIVELIPNRLLKTTYWSGFSEREDIPENYLLVSYQISEADGETTLTITTENNPSAVDAEDASKNWEYVLHLMKDLLEK